MFQVRVLPSAFFLILEKWRHSIEDQRARMIEERRVKYIPRMMMVSAARNQRNQPEDQAHQARPERAKAMAMAIMTTRPRVVDLASSTGRESGRPPPPRLGTMA